MNILFRTFRHGLSKISYSKRNDHKTKNNNKGYSNFIDYKWLSFLAAFGALNQINYVWNKHNHNYYHAYCLTNDNIDSASNKSNESDTTTKNNDNVNKEEISREQKIKAMSKMKTYDIGASIEFREGELREVVVNHEGKDFKVIVTKIGNRLYATGATCTYDDKTCLREGVIFGDKLYCPLHGCAYSITTGNVEYPPAHDNLPIFYVAEKNGRVYLSLPKYPPKKVLPPFEPRDYNDLRKVLIIGSGIAAMSCVETLRSTGYTGEIKVISQDTTMPYDKTKLYKSFKNLNYEDAELRSEEFYNDLGIEIMLGREVKFIDNRHGTPYIELEDGLKLEYDALLIATGTKPSHPELSGTKNRSNIYYLKTFKDHKKIKNMLEKANKIAIIGANMQSLEVASTIKSEYPHMEIQILDENETIAIEDEYGYEIANAIVDMHIKNGINFMFQNPILTMQGEGDLINKIILKDGNEVPTDLVLLFPNNVEANTDFLLDGENMDNLEFNLDGKLSVEYDQRAGHKRIFAAGSCCNSLYFATTERMYIDTYNLSAYQGSIAAYNILALGVPGAYVPYYYYKHFNNSFQHAGYMKEYDDIYIDGDLEKMDFIAYYAYDGQIQAALAVGNHKKDIMIINEALRLQLMPEIEQIKSKIVTIKTIEQAVRESKRSGSFRDLLYEIRYDANPEDVVWIQREKVDEYYNFWEKGQQPMGPNKLTDDS